MGFPSTSKGIICHDGKFCFHSSIKSSTNTFQEGMEHSGLASATLPKKEVSVWAVLPANVSCRHVNPTNTSFPICSPLQRANKGMTCVGCIIHFFIFCSMLSGNLGLPSQHRQSRKQISIFHVKNEPLKHPRTFILSDLGHYKDYRTWQRPKKNSL